MKIKVGDKVECIIATPYSSLGATGIVQSVGYGDCLVTWNEDNKSSQGCNSTFLHQPDNVYGWWISQDTVSKVEETKAEKKSEYNGGWGI